MRGDGALSAATALFARDLRADLRTGLPILMRTGVAVALLALLVVAHADRASITAPGHTLFTAVVTFDAIAMVVCGAVLFPVLLLSEREHGGYELLRLAGLGPTAFLLGRSLGILALLACLALVQLPFLVLSIALGGVDLGHVASAAVLLSCHTALLYGGALSACSRANDIAAGVRHAAVLTLMLSYGPSALAWLFAWRSPWQVDGVVQALRTAADWLPSGSLLDLPAVGALRPLALSWLAAALVLLGAGVWLWDIPRAQPQVPLSRDPLLAIRPYPAASPLRAHAARWLGGGRRARLKYAAFACFVMLQAWARSRGDLSVWRWLALAQAITMIMHVGWLAAGSTRVHVAASTLELLALTQQRAAWLAQVRVGRGWWIALHAVLLGILTVLAMRHDSPSMLSVLLVMVMSSVALADAAGERCGLAAVRAPQARGVLCAFGVLAVGATVVVFGPADDAILPACVVIIFQTSALWLYSDTGNLFAPSDGEATPESPES